MNRTASCVASAVLDTSQERFEEREQRFQPTAGPFLACLTGSVSRTVTGSMAGRYSRSALMAYSRTARCFFSSAE